MKILVVDDQEMLRKSVLALLQFIIKREEVRIPSDVTILESQNGHEAFMLWEEHRDSIQIIITDYHMPVLNGEGLIEKVRAACGGGGPLIILLSGGGIISNSKADVFIQKPFTAADLVRGFEKLGQLHGTGTEG